MKRLVDFIKKNKLLVILGVITFIRVLFSFDLPNYYLKNMIHDDYLMVKLSDFMSDNLYLGEYDRFTLIKGILFPFILSICNSLSLSYAFVFTILYVLSCIYFTLSFKDIFSKRIMIILYIVLLFNPISYSMELFQRLYRNGISLFLVLFLLGSAIRFLKSSNLKNGIVYSSLMGFFSSLLLLTREDTFWVYIVVFLVIIYKVLSLKNIKYLFVGLFSILVIFLNLNVVSFINYKYYGVYTYNEISDSYFKDAYLKIQQIKDENKYDRVSITKSSLYRLSSVSEMFNLTYSEIDRFYIINADDNGEIDNGKIMWILRKYIYEKEGFKNGKEANLYFEELALEIDSLFEKGVLEKEFVLITPFMDVPTISEIKKMPSKLLESFVYVNSYKNVRSLSREAVTDLDFVFDYKHNSFYIKYRDYHDAENIVTDNILLFEIIRIIYMCFMFVLSIVSILLFVFNLKKIRNLKNFIIFMMGLIYLLIFFGVVYTDVTGFVAMRYFYFGPVYLLGNILVILLMEDVFDGRFKVNNINALFKRRKNNRKVHNRG